MQWPRARSPAQGRDIPSIAITAHYEDFPAAGARDFTAYLRKPLQMEGLCRTIAALCGRDRRRRAEGRLRVQIWRRPAAAAVELRSARESFFLS